jgi:hypothetical protein
MRFLVRKDISGLKQASLTWRNLLPPPQLKNLPNPLVSGANPDGRFWIFGNACCTPSQWFEVGQLFLLGTITQQTNMKTIKHNVLVTLTSLLFAVLPAKANLIQATDPSFGLNSLTIDTATGLGWLDLTASTGRSYQQVLAATQPGGIYSGFRFATAQEVLNLYSDAGIPGIGFYSLSTPAIQSLISLLGAPGLINGMPGLLGLSATSPSPGLQNAPVIYAVGKNATEEYWVNENTSYGVTFSDPEVGSWLVSNVRESSDASINILTAASLVGFSHLLRRQNAT